MRPSFSIDQVLRTPEAGGRIPSGGRAGFLRRGGVRSLGASPRRRGRNYPSATDLLPLATTLSTRNRSGVVILLRTSALIFAPTRGSTNQHKHLNHQPPLPLPEFPGGCSNKHSTTGFASPTTCADSRPAYRRHCLLPVAGLVPKTAPPPKILLVCPLTTPLNRRYETFRSFPASRQNINAADPDGSVLQQKPATHELRRLFTRILTALSHHRTHLRGVDGPPDPTTLDTSEQSG